MKVKPDRVRDWESSGKISLAQTDGMARHTRTPLGYLFLTSNLLDAIQRYDERKHDVLMRDSRKPPT